MMDKLDHLEYIKIYLDDVLIHSKNFEDHLSHIKIVFNILRYNRAEINFQNIKIFQYGSNLSRTSSDKQRNTARSFEINDSKNL